MSNFPSSVYEIVTSNSSLPGTNGHFMTAELGEQAGCREIVPNVSINFLIKNWHVMLKLSIFDIFSKNSYTLCVAGKIGRCQN